MTRDSSAWPATVETAVNVTISVVATVVKLAEVVPVIRLFPADSTVTVYREPEERSEKVMSPPLYAALCSLP